MQLVTSSPITWRVRIFAFGLLIAGAVTLSSLFGGIFPSSWRLLLQTLPQFSLLWRLHGVAILPPLTLLMVQSFFILLGWLSLAFVAYAIVASVSKQSSSASLPQQMPTSSRMGQTTLITDLSAIQILQRAKQPPSSNILTYDETPDREEVYELEHTSPTMALSVGTRTIAGKERRHELNTDHVFAQRWNASQYGRQIVCGLFLVADGDSSFMKGHEVSRLTTQVIIRTLIPPLLTKVENAVQIKNLLADAIQSANDAIYIQNEQQHLLGNSSLAVALIIGDKAYTSQIGNCRSYLYHAHEEKLTLLLDRPHDRNAHSDSSRMAAKTIVLGDDPLMTANISSHPLQKGDSLLLCSDGLWSVLPEQALEDIARQHNFDAAYMADALSEHATRYGAEDNMSIIVVSLQ